MAVAFTDMIRLDDSRGNAHFYARNARGLHVPVETLTPADRDAAQNWERWVEREHTND